MVKCCVPGCSSVGSRIFHSFPSNTQLREQWIEKTKTYNLTEKDFKGYAKVCRYHFKETDFQVNQRNQRGLKDNSVPSLRLPVTGMPSKPSTDHQYFAVSYSKF